MRESGVRRILSLALGWHTKHQQSRNPILERSRTLHQLVEYEIYSPWRFFQITRCLILTLLCRWALRKLNAPGRYSTAHHCKICRHGLFFKPFATMKSWLAVMHAKTTSSRRLRVSFGELRHITGRKWLCLGDSVS